jgi:hypothetical protein
MLRVRLPGALYRLALETCGGNNTRLNTAIVRLLEHDDWLEQVVDELALPTEQDGGDE